MRKGREHSPHPQPESPPPEKHYSIESRELTEQAREHVTALGLELMKDIFDSIDDYTVFASTAMYLHGLKKGIEELQTLPGDFDAAVQSKQSLDRIRERLSNVPGVFFRNQGQYTHFPDGNAIALQGHIPIKTKDHARTVVVDYEFEIFFNSRIVPDQLFSRVERLHGLKILSLEGLQEQYGQNLGLEKRIEQSTKRVMHVLLDGSVEPRVRNEISRWDEVGDPDDFEPSSSLSQMLEKYSLTMEELKAFYHEVEAYRDTHATDPVEPTSKMSTILAGQKTKISKRQRNIDQLTRLRRVNLDENEK